MLFVCATARAASPAPAPSASACPGGFDDGSVFECPANNALVVRLFASAREHDTPAILALGPRVEGPTAPSGVGGDYARVTYELALAVADPARFAARYVRSIAESGFSVFHLLQIYSDDGFVPQDMPFAMVRGRARAGDPYAFAAMLSSAIHPLNEFDAGFDAAAVAANPRRFFAAARVMPRSSLLDYICTRQDIDRSPGSAAAFAAALHPRDAFERSVVADLRSGSRNCSPYDANF